MSNERMTAGTSIIRACSCASPFQDARYGKGQRVHNVGKSASDLVVRMIETETA